MDFLGIGPLEVIFILIIALIIFGPNDIVRAGKSLGSFMRKVVTSDAWRAFQQASKGMRDIPTTLMREAGLEEDDLRELTGVKDFEQTTKELENQISAWTTPPKTTPVTPTKSGIEETIGKPEQIPTENPSSEQETLTVSEEPPTPPPGSPFSQTIDDNN